MSGVDAAAGPAATPPPRRRWRLSRRGFLIGVGATGAGLLLGMTVGVPELRLQIARVLDDATAPASFSQDPLAWFELTADGPLRLYVTKAEMGQGIHTALAQIAADELELPWPQLQVVQAGTHHGPQDSFGVSSSNSVASVYAPLRQAAATLREMLRAEAALALGQPAAALVARAGAFELVDDSAQRVTYAELAARPVAWEVPAEPAPLKSAAHFQLIGQSLPRVDIPAKVTGQALYGYDKRAEGMLYGAMVRPPTLGATLRRVNSAPAQAVDGVVQVVEEPGFVGVVARSRIAAQTALNRIEAEWEQGHLWQQAELEALLTVDQAGGVTVQRVGRTPTWAADNSSLVAEYRTPLAAHVSMEPPGALADVRADRAQIWAPTQNHERLRGKLATALALPPEQVEVIPTYLGGGFGRKLDVEAAIEAARLSQAAGMPVHVGWTRTEDIRYGYFRPPTFHRIYGALGTDGRISAMEHRQASGDVSFPFFPPIAAALLGADFGSWRGATIPYAAIPNRKTVAWRVQLPVPTGWWRGLGLLANTYALESAMDELAHLAGADPLAFRLQHLGDDLTGRRTAAVLQAAAERAGWGRPLPAGRALGIACCIDVDTAVAEVAEVSLDRASGQIQVHQVTVAMDSGLTINPNGATAQAQGAVMMGTSSALIEEITVRDGQVVPGNFDRYPLLTLDAAPHVEVLLLETADGKPRGVGEPPIGPVAAAIGNAFFALTGVRLRQLPMTPQRVVEALG